MNDDDLKHLLHRGVCEVLREDFTAFLQRSFLTLHPAEAYLPNWHIDAMAEYLEACRHREITRLIINLPPRALKSLTVSVAWPAFLLGQNPSERIMAASYSAKLSQKHSQDCRHILQSPWYGDVFPNTRLSPSQNEKHKFSTCAHGHRIATSVGGTATGEGGNFLILDDPQNPSHMQGESGRRHAREWFDHTFSSRLDDKRRGVIVLVMQRLHADDLTGHLLEKGGWEHLCLPAVAERAAHISLNGKSWQRAEGEALHPAREDEGMIRRAQRELGSLAFAAQYQQAPLPEEGHMLRREWLRRYRDLPEGRIVQSWDTAVKAGQGHDASVCLTMIETAEGAYLQDVTVLRAEYPELRKMILRMAEAYQPQAILLEDKASGQSLLQDIRREVRGLPLIGICPTQDKLTRFAAVSALIEAGKLWLPVDAPWLAAFEAELLQFPHGRHDDQVDALSQYLNWSFRRKQTPLPGMRRLT